MGRKTKMKKKMTSLSLSSSPLRRERVIAVNRVRGFFTLRLLTFRSPVRNLIALEVPTYTGPIIQKVKVKEMGRVCVWMKECKRE